MDKTIVDNYTMGAQIGKGTFGEVYKAQHKTTKEMVAIKIVNMKNCEEKDKKHIDDEIKISRSCGKHDNLVQFYRSFEKGHYLYIVMELCTGGDLRQYIKENAQSKYIGLDETTCITVLRQVTNGISYLHGRDVLHRDVKTTNIFISRNQDTGPISVKVGDFGLARKFNTDNPTLLVGTPYFMSPEMINGEPYGKPTDIWSLGCCVYEMATTYIPFNSYKMDSLKKKVNQGKVVLENCSYCEKLKTMVQSMLSQNPLHRPDIANIEEFLTSHKHSSPSSESRKKRIASGKSSFSQTWTPGQLQSSLKVEASGGEPRRRGNSLNDDLTGAHPRAGLDSSGYLTDTKDKHVDDHVTVHVRVKMNADDVQIFKTTEDFNEKVRVRLIGNKDIIMEQINNAIEKTKLMDDDKVFMSEVAKIEGVGELNTLHKLNLESLWKYKRLLMQKDFKIDW